MTHSFRLARRTARLGAHTPFGSILACAIPDRINFSLPPILNNRKSLP
jgi:hypothetical protein